MGNLFLEGKVVRLRLISVEDAGLTLKWRLGDRAKFLHRGAESIQEQEKWITVQKNTDAINCIIEYKNKSVGMIALHDIDINNRHLIIGRLLIGEENYVGKAPVAYESELLLCDYAFDQLKAHKIYGDVVENNKPMLKFRSYLGWKKDGVLRDHVCFDGKFFNIHALSLLENEYKAECRPKLVQLIDIMEQYGE